MNCQICQRDIPDDCMERHHLVPKSRRRKGPKLPKITIKVCTNCGDQIHKLFTNKELEKKFNTLEALLADEKMQKWINWIGKKQHYSVPQKTMKRR